MLQKKFPPRGLRTLRSMADNSELLQQAQFLKKLFDDGPIAQDKYDAKMEEILRLGAWLGGARPTADLASRL